MLTTTLLAFALAACGDDAAGPDSGRGSDGGGANDPGRDAGAPIDPDWQTEYCRSRECWFVMQNEPGASDAECNGRHPTDLGTMDAMGKRDCPFATLTGPIQQVMNPEVPRPEARAIFVGRGNYPVAPYQIHLFGAGRNASETFLFTTWRGEEVTIDGNCPASCTVETPSGPITAEPCCFRACPTCDASPLCEPNPLSETGCALPIDRVNQLVTIYGQWVRIEGFRLLGCFEDNVRVSIGTDGGAVIPNRHIYIANNEIEGCDVNENVKGLRNGPGPRNGGPEWGPVHVIGNELFSMASQAVDATGVHRWLVEDNYVHDAKVGSNPFVSFDGGGIGFKNDSTDNTVRNNWSVDGGGFGMGGGSGSCIDDEYGCYQMHEATAGLIENNVAIRPAAAAPEGQARGFLAYQCLDCSYLGNVIELDDGAALRIDDECPGPTCPAHNPMLRPSENLRFERNFIRGLMRRPSGGPLMMLYRRDVLASGPAANGMVSRSNVFCAGAGFPVVADPNAGALQFAHLEPDTALALDDYRSHIGDTGSAVFNAAGSAMAPCPAGPLACEVGVASNAVRWAGPSDCATCDCTLVIDGVESDVECTGSTTLTAVTPGRHYASLRIDRDGGGASCGASFGIAADTIGAGCTIDVNGDTVSWSSTGVHCRLLSDGGTDLGEVACTGAMSTPAFAPGRHHLRLQVRDAPEGQTTCGAMFNR
jgi:hypothetical protein